MVRKYRYGEIDEIRTSLFKIGLGGGIDEEHDDEEDDLKKSIHFLGCEGDPSSVSIGSQLNDGSRSSFDIVNLALKQRAKVNAIAAEYEGFTPDEVQTLRARFQSYDEDRSGEINATELRTLCQDVLPDLSTDAKCRPELLRLLKEVDSDGDGCMNFQDFTKLMRNMHDSRTRTRLAKEQRIFELVENEFTKSQIRDFREIFVHHDDQGKDVLSFETVTRLLQNIVDLGSRSANCFADMWQKASEEKPTGSSEAWTLDFPDFILLWHQLLDSDFCGIKDKSEKAAERAEQAKEKSRKLKSTQHADRSKTFEKRLVDQRRGSTVSTLIQQGYLGTS
jgi:Ca2+-binding EF-hand superfamily protein